MMYRWYVVSWLGKSLILLYLEKNLHLHYTTKWNQEEITFSPNPHVVRSHCCAVLPSFTVLFSGIGHCFMHLRTIAWMVHFRSKNLCVPFDSTPSMTLYPRFPGGIFLQDYQLQFSLSRHFLLLFLFHKMVKIHFYWL